VQLVVTPDLTGLSDVSGFGGIDAAEDSDAFTMFRILAHGNIDAVLIKDWRGVDLTGAFRGGIFGLFSIGRVAIILSDRLKKCAVPFLDRFRIERIAKTIASAEEDQLAAIDNAEGRGTPLSVKDTRADVGIIFGKEFAGLGVQGNKAGGIGRGNVGMGP